MTIGHIQVGHGPHRVLALHGWFGSARGWGWLPELIDADRFSYAFMDFRGYGSRIAEPGAFTVAEMAADARSLADQLGWETFSVLGHSMGGIVAQRVLADAPSRVDRLVGISPVPAGGVPFDEAGWALFDGAATNAANRRAIIDLTTGGRLSGHWLDGMVRFSLEESDRAAFGAYLAAWARTDLTGVVQGNPVPALAVVGGHDPALGEQTMRQTWLRHYPDARLEVCPDAGHYAMYETPVYLDTVLTDFLTGSA